MGQFTAGLRMLMPETAVHKDGYFLTPKHNVRFSRQISGMEAKAQTHPMKQPTNGHFGSGITAFDPPHAFAALNRRQRVHRLYCSSAAAL